MPPPRDTPEPRQIGQRGPRPRRPYLRSICMRGLCPHTTTGERPGALCPKHEAERDRAKAARRPDLRAHAERQRRAQTVAAWRAEHGDWCPGWAGAPAHWQPRPPHFCDPPGGRNPLSADHVEGPGYGPLVVRCLSCNGARGSASAVARRRGRRWRNE